jgi:hypothetical protein
MALPELGLSVTEDQYNDGPQSMGRSGPLWAP